MNQIGFHSSNQIGFHSSRQKSPNRGMPAYRYVAVTQALTVHIHSFTIYPQRAFEVEYKYALLCYFRPLKLQARITQITSYPRPHITTTIMSSNLDQCPSTNFGASNTQHLNSGSLVERTEAASDAHAVAPTVPPTSDPAAERPVPWTPFLKRLRACRGFSVTDSSISSRGHQLEAYSLPQL